MEIDDESQPAFRLPNEMWLEIFQNFDITQLVDLALVCKQWNSLIFAHFAHRIRLSFDLDLRKYPSAGMRMVEERPYRHLSLKSFKLDSPPALLDIIKQLAVNLDSLKLEVTVLEGEAFSGLLLFCTRIEHLNVKATYLECDESVYGLRQRLPSITRLDFNVASYVSTFNFYSFESLFMRTMPNVSELEIMVSRPLDVTLVVWMAPRLKRLKATVDCCAINNFLGARLPMVEHLELNLLQPEQQWRKRRTFQIKSFRDFLLGFKALKTALLSFRCEYDQPLLDTIYANLPTIEGLQLSGGLATERVSLNGLERMKRLKALSLHCLLLADEDQRVVAMPALENFSLCTYIRPNNFGSILKRFPNLKALKFRLHNNELLSIADFAPSLEKLSIDLYRITPEMIGQLERLVNLKRLSVDVHVFARTNFRLLRNILTLPVMKQVEITTRSNIPPNIAALVAASNPVCKFVLNGETVKPATKTRRVGVKRKQKATENANKSVDASVATDDSLLLNTSEASGSNLSASEEASEEASFLVNESQQVNESDCVTMVICETCPERHEGKVEASGVDQPTADVASNDVDMDVEEREAAPSKVTKVMETSM